MSSVVSTLDYGCAFEKVRAKYPTFDLGKMLYENDRNKIADLIKNEQLKQLVVIRLEVHNLNRIYKVYPFKAVWSSHHDNDGRGNNSITINGQIISLNYIVGLFYTK